MSKDSTAHVLIVALLLCVVCSVLVSAAAVGLRDLQEQNKAMEKRKNILQAAGIFREDRPVSEQFATIETRLVDLQTGTFSDRFNPVTFDSRSASRAPETGYRIPSDFDRAGIKERSRYQDVYLVMQGNQLDQLILPVHGKGLWSTMYGFIALAGDLNSVNGFAFYEHGETPGLGGEIDNPTWQRQWRGKKIYGPDGRVRITISKGRVAASDPQAQFKADGLAGATLTARGVENLLGYWMGENGYRPFLDRLKSEGVGL